MSNMFDDGAHISPVRAATSPTQQHHREVAARDVQSVKVVEPAFKIDLSPEAKAALDGIREKETTERADRAMQSAKEISATVGVSAEKAVDVVQPTRSPPPAKGVALFQANLSAGK
ncbi:MAG: hypothetical protein ACKVH0_05795 [Alphaproteobacteria bacterium]